MSAIRRMLVLALVFLGSLLVAQNQRQQPNEGVAAQVFGPRWKQLSRDSELIFSGTVLGVHTPRGGDRQTIPIVEVSFRVDRAIAGVHSREVLTIHEWAGAWSEHRLRTGQRVLLLLYPRSHLGLTSPVGGLLGQVELSGDNTVLRPVFVPDSGNSPQMRRRDGESGAPISLHQLERAIRNARNSQPAHDGVIAQEE